MTNRNDPSDPLRVIQTDSAPVGACRKTGHFEPPLTLNIRADGNKTERRSTNRMDAMTLDVMVEKAHAAEHAGFDGIALMDHLVASLTELWERCPVAKGKYVRLAAE